MHFIRSKWNEWDAVASNLTFSLPYATGMQLREIARHHDSTPAEIVAGWIRTELKASNIASAYNPMEVTFEPDAGVLDLAFFGGECTLRLSPERTEALSKLIIDMATLGGTPASLLDGDAAAVEPAIAVARHGAAFVMNVGSWRKTMSPWIALEIARDLTDGVSNWTDLNGSSARPQEPATDHIQQDSVTNNNPNFGIFA